MPYLRFKESLSHRVPSASKTTLSLTPPEVWYTLTSVTLRKFAPRDLISNPPSPEALHPSPHVRIGGTAYDTKMLSLSVTHPPAGPATAQPAAALFTPFPPAHMLARAVAPGGILASPTPAPSPKKTHLSTTGAFASDADHQRSARGGET